MAASLNKVLLIGNLGKDADTRETASGATVTTFSVATTTRRKDASSGEWRDFTDWHDVVLWRGEKVARYLRKGKKVFIEGRLQTRNWEDPGGQRRYKTEVVCDSFGLMLLGGRDESSGGSYGGGYQSRSQGGYDQGGGRGSYGGGQSRSEYREEKALPAPREDRALPAPASETQTVDDSVIDDDDLPF